MPYSTTAELPAEIKKQYSEKALAAFMAAFNNVMKTTKDEARAFAAAHSAAKKVDMKESENATFEFEAVFTEAPKHDEDSGVYTIPVTLIKPGMSKNKVHYSKDWLAKFADMMEGKKAYLDHEKKSEIKDRNSRSVKDVAGWYEGVHQAEDGSVKGMLKLVETPTTEHVIKVAKANPELVGLSINARGKASRGKIDGETAMIAETVTKVHSCDLVVEAAAGGEMESMRLVAGVLLDDNPDTETEEKPMDESTVQWLMAERVYHAEKAAIDKGRQEMVDMASWLDAESKHNASMKAVEDWLIAEKDEVTKDLPDKLKEATDKMDVEGARRFVESMKEVLPEKPAKSAGPAEDPKPGEEGYKRHFFS